MAAQLLGNGGKIESYTIIIMQSGSWHLWIYFSGLKDEAVKYKASIKFYLNFFSYFQNQSCMDYVGNVFPMNVEHMTIENNLNGLVFNDTTAKGLVYHHTLNLWRRSSIRYTCTIAKW
jgi:hypothetical protein